MPLINCEVSLILIWSEICVITSLAYKRAVAAVAGINNLTNAAFEITDTKLYVPVVTLSTENYNKLLEQLKIGFKRTIKWNKYRSEMTNQTIINNLNLFDPTFYPLKMKMIELPFQSIMYQVLK